LQKEQIIVERRAQARAKYEQIKKAQEIKIKEAPLNIMKDDFAFRRVREDDMRYRPGFKEAEQLKITDKVGGLRGVTDFEAFDQKVKVKKQ